jgi:small GTP-binding protein
LRLLTPPGRGGVAVVVTEGAAERAVVKSCLFRRGGAVLSVRPGEPPRLARLRLPDGGAEVDEVLVLDRGPAGVELHLHGSPLVLSQLEVAFGPLAGTQPGPAERLLRGAISEPQLALALEQRDCDFAAFCAAMAALPPDERRAVAAAARERTRVARALAEPCRVVLTGLQNAGKSTLMNRLLFRERVLTGAEPGSTRDPVTEQTELGGYPYEFVDTAGEGPTATELDRQALGRARAERARGLQLLVVDGGRGPQPGDRALWNELVVVVATKADLPPAPWPADLPRHLQVSCVDPAASPTVRRAVGAVLQRWRRLPAAGPVGGPAALDADQAARLEAAAGRT